MPISHTVDHDRRLVTAHASGTLTDQDVFDYQLTVWSRKDVAGYDELIDMTDVVEIVPPPAARLQQLASVAARMESSNSTSKFAVIAPTDIAFGLGRMFQAFREHSDRGARKIGVFRSAKEAKVFLGLEAPTPDAPSPPHANL